MKFVEDAKKRETAYKSRLRTLVKKTSELAALCGVDIRFTAGKPGMAGIGGERGVTVWPADRDLQKKLAKRIRETPTKRIKENLNIRTYLQDELGKEHRKLVKIKLCGLDDRLPVWNPHLDDLPVDDVFAVHNAMGDTLERARAELGSMDTVPVSAALPALQNAPTFLGNASSVGVQDYYLLQNILPSPFQNNVFENSWNACTSIGGQDPPSCTGFGAPPMPFMPLPPAASVGISFSGRGIDTTDRLLTPTTEFSDDFIMQGPREGFSVGPNVPYHQDFPTYDFDDGTGSSVGYEFEHRAGGIWPLGTQSNPLDTSAYQLQNDTMLWSDNNVGHHTLNEQE